MFFPWISALVYPRDVVYRMSGFSLKITWTRLWYQWHPIPFSVIQPNQLVFLRDYPFPHFCQCEFLFPEYFFWSLLHLPAYYLLRCLLSGFIILVYHSTWRTAVSRNRQTWRKMFSLTYNINLFFGQTEDKRKNFDYVDDVRFIIGFTVTALHSYACGLEFRIFSKIFRLATDFQDKFTWFSLQPCFNVVGIEGFFCIAWVTSTSCVC
jgi:hypothetical protein